MSDMKEGVLRAP